jgi:selenocysteine lyase/cysteine desulfurase
VLLDAASFAPAQRLSLRHHPADFVAVSFYKMFGYPTGVGALVARRDALERLSRPWFAGGTVEYVSIRWDRHRLRALHEGFEDGTPNFLSIAALELGFEMFERVGFARMCAHSSWLIERLAADLRRMTHANGRPVVSIYGPPHHLDCGSTIAFNVLDRRGRTVPYWQVEREAANASVAFRGGCFCNPGASEAAFGLDAAEGADCLSRLGADFSPERYKDCLGPDATVGAVRASVGLATNADDVDRAIDVIAGFRR